MLDNLQGLIHEVLGAFEQNTPAAEPKVYDEIFIPALLLAWQDRQQGILAGESEALFLQATQNILADFVAIIPAAGGKEAPETRAIPIVALTAHAIAGDHERAVQAGCDDYHAKPVEFQRLLTQIAALLNKTSVQ